MNEAWKPDQDILDAVFKLGECTGLLSRHRKTHPEHVLAVYQQMIDIGTAGERLIGQTNPAPDPAA